jgi:FtsZ-interacting cell division protein ZipA
VTAVIVIVVAVVIVAIVLGAMAARRRRRADTVAVFQRQIDALSPEARRPVVDQVQQLDESGSAEGDERAP